MVALAGGRHGGRSDLISALPDDLLLHVLAGILSRRWRGLWARLPALTFRDVPFGALHAALASLQPVAPTLLDIGVSEATLSLSQLGYVRFRERISSFLHAAAGLAPAELRFAVRQDVLRLVVRVRMPRFHRAASVELHGLELVLADADRPPEFPALERLSLSHCRVDLAGLLRRCPRLRALRVAKGSYNPNIVVHSASLQELDMESKNLFAWSVDIDAPALKQLTLTFRSGCVTTARVSVSPPALEKVSWRCVYPTVTVGHGIWGLSAVRLEAAEANGQLRPHIHVLSLFMAAHVNPSNFLEAGISFTEKIEKHMVTSFSDLELDLVARGHVYGAFVSLLLAMDRIRAATQNLKIILLRSGDEEACPVNCPCDEPKNWRSQAISLTNLENVEIKGFQGKDDEIDFLKLVFRCAPMLKGMTLTLTDEVTRIKGGCMKIHDIFKVYPFVECNVDPS